MEVRGGVRIRRLGLGVPGGVYGPAALTVRGGSSFEDAALTMLAAVPCTPTARGRPAAILAQIQLLSDCKQVSFYGLWLPSYDMIFDMTLTD